MNLAGAPPGQHGPTEGRSLFSAGSRGSESFALTSDTDV
jgi:hypothetical protein